MPSRIIQRALLVLTGAIVLLSAYFLPVRAETYVCPPCGHNCLETTFDAPGACGECGMPLVTLEQVLNQPVQHEPDTANRPKVAILLFDGVEIIDYAAPWEIFGGAGFEVFSVALSKTKIRTIYGMQVTPDYTLADHPKADIVLVPGGSVFKVQNDPRVKKWLNEASRDAEVVLSVCNGAFILAKAGLLKGKKATTTRHLVEGLANAGEGITVVRDVRYVDNGKVITAGGLSAGMDAALHVVARYAGQESAARMARGLEYDWRSE